MTHLTDKEILALLMKDDASNRNRVDHLHDCASCRQRYVFFKRLESGMRNVFNEKLNLEDEGESGQAENPLDGCLDPLSLSSYVEGICTPLESSEIKSHLESCDRCFDAVAFYFKSSRSMTSAMKGEGGIPSSKAVSDVLSQLSKKPAASVLNFKKAPGLSEKISDFLKTIFASPVPAYGLAAVCVMVIFFRGGSPPLQVISVKGSSHLITFSDTSSGGSPLSFMGNSGVNRERYEGMKITVRGEEIVFEWTQVPGAASYTFVIEDLSSGSIEITETIVANGFVALERERLSVATPYRWVVTGDLQGREKFRIEGDFIIGQG